jgi:hypothetical protein
VIFGTMTAVKQVLATQGWQINTAFIKRLTIRQPGAGVGRRVLTLFKGEAGLHQQLALYQVYYNFCLPHASLRLPLPQPRPTYGSGSAKQWRPHTPAMAAGLADHGTLRKMLLFRMPPWPQPKRCRWQLRYEDRETERTQCTRGQAKRTELGPGTVK